MKYLPPADIYFRRARRRQITSSELPYSLPNKRTFIALFTKAVTMFFIKRFSCFVL